MKRILAIIGIVLLVLLYVTTLVSAIINSPASIQLFKASIAMTILIPVLIAGYQIIYRVVKSYSPTSRAEDPTDEPNTKATEKNE